MSFNSDELQFWLPSHFLADDDDVDGDQLVDTKFRASSRFLLTPIDNNGSNLSSPGKSLVGSTETDSDEDVFLLSELTHQLSQLAPTRPEVKNYVHSGSPQSTLLHVESFSGLSNGSSNGSPNGPSSQVSSPRNAPLPGNNNNCSRDLISKAVGVVEGLKTNSSGVLTSPIQPPATVFHRQGSFPTLTPPKSAAVYPNYNVRNEELSGGVGYGIRVEQVRKGPNNVYSGQKIDGLATVNAGGWSPILYGGYPNLQLGPSGGGGCGIQLGGGFGGGVAHGYGYGSGNRVRIGDVVKNERVGTGVFLPRRFDEKNRGNSNSGNAVDTRKKSGNLASHAVKKVPTMTKNLNNRSSSTQCAPKIFGCDTITNNYEALLARKVCSPGSVPTLQRKTVPFPEVPIHHEICLPQEWTY